MLCDYANQKSPYFPDGSHFTSVPDILKDLDSQFKDSVLQHKYYDRKSDPFVVVREREGYNRDPVSEGLLHFASTAGYGMLQDYAMSVMSLAYLESHVYRGKPVFRSLELVPRARWSLPIRNRNGKICHFLPRNRHSVWQRRLTGMIKQQMVWIWNSEKKKKHPLLKTAEGVLRRFSFNLMPLSRGSPCGTPA